ncbi:Serine/threonine-protein phosphatase 2A 55 kDa regulatory subunit B beta isoform [Sciurus carolinensis]|uniref:Serine/threonine-protein phosphatase 2A 55 kDa regulatory subunit B beta isoform n=1 Tax=Sciurus carolinensis TaxID=30640 RepID=A0AA41MU77_SCICA|nr:Serine/threonine-protein phosphatase 2A 55 kDa regulatory subunit B beta isoform [Sciurus carolinensis]
MFDMFGELQGMGVKGVREICWNRLAVVTKPLLVQADIISTVEFNHTGELLATGDKGGRVVIFQREQESKNQVHRRGEYNVYSTFQSHEPEFDYLKSLEIEEKINKIRWLPQQNAAYFLLSTNVFEEPEDPSNRSFFSEIISSISDVKFSHSGRYIMTRDYLTVKVWDLNMENRPIETYQVHDYLRSKLCSLYENDCIFDKFECVWNGSDSVIMTGSYNNFFRMFDRNTKRDVTLEASRENSKPRAILKPRKVCVGGKRRKDEISVDSLDFSKKILHTAWHPSENIIAVAATNNLYIFQDKVN